MSKERVVLVHGYLTDRGEKDRPDRLTRVGILAGAEAYRNGEVDKICFATIEELSHQQTKRLKTLLNTSLKEDDIVVRPEAISTREEVKMLKKIAEEESWDDLSTIGNDVHTTRIKREIENVFKSESVNVRGQREVLSEYPRYSGILSDMDSWAEQKSLSAQEDILNIPVLGNIILATAPYIKKIKVPVQEWVFRKYEGD